MRIVFFLIFIIHLLKAESIQAKENCPENELSKLILAAKDIQKHLNYFQPIDPNNPNMGFVLKLDKNVKVDLITKTEYPKFFLPTINFQGVRDLFESQNRHVLYMAVGPYYDHSRQVEGLTIDNGKQVGYKDLYEKHSAAVTILNNKPAFHYLPELSKDKIRDLIKKTEEKEGDLFQQHFAIHNGKATSTRHDMPDYERGKKYIMRFLVEYEDKSQGVLQLDEPMTWAQATKALKKNKIKNAVYMDMGSMAYGVMVDENNEAWVTGRPTPKFPLSELKSKSPLYTNLLVFYIDK